MAWLPCVSRVSRLEKLVARQQAVVNAFLWTRCSNCAFLGDEGLGFGDVFWGSAVLRQLLPELSSAQGK